MMPTSLDGMADGRILALAAGMGDTATAMIALIFGLLVVTSLAILLGGGRRLS